jgi:hypothetical protein
MRDYHRSNDEKDMPQSSASSTGDANADVASKKKLINVAYFIQGGTGEIIGRYVKKNLWISERSVLFSYPALLVQPNGEINTASTYIQAQTTTLSSPGTESPSGSSSAGTLRTH